MNKRRRMLKHRRDTVRTTVEPNYRHEAWGSDTPPTPDTVPEAFYQYSVPAHPREVAPETRRKPHRSVSVSMLRKRLYRAGLTGTEAKRTLDDILAGEQVENGLGGPMSWHVSIFRERFGRRIAREVLRFVDIRVLVLDEFGYYAAPGLANLAQQMMSFGRKHSVTPVVVEQTLPPPVAVARRVSFWY